MNVFSFLLLPMSPCFATDFFVDYDASSQQISSSQMDCRTAFDKEFEDFCFDLFSREFGYTLIGIKPISTDELPCKYCNEKGERCLAILREMFQGSPNFVLKIICSGPFRSIELINRKSLRKLVGRNCALRSFIMEVFGSEERFFSKIENPSRSIHRILRANDRMIGYCLGYDKTNIDYYLRRVELGIYLQKYPLVLFHPIPGGKYSDCPNIFTNMTLDYEPLKPRKGFDSLESEWQWIKDIEWDIEKNSDPTPPYFVYLPVYVCRYGGGSETARERFKRASLQVAELFCGKKPSSVIAFFASK